MSAMKALLERLIDLDVNINPLELEVGKQILLKQWGNVPLTITKIKNDNKEYCKNFGMEGIVVRPDNEVNEYYLWFDTESLRKEGRLGKNLAKIQSIVGQKNLF